jgi:hypothetical protein
VLEDHTASPSKPFSLLRDHFLSFAYWEKTLGVDFRNKAALSYLKQLKAQ